VPAVWAAEAGGGPFVIAEELMALSTFVLVHGAWSGAYNYRRVRPLLQAAGHDVFTPSLTGLGDRAHLVSPLVNLSTHIRDVVNLVLYEDLRDIVLVGHSYGGMVVTGTVDHIADRIAHLVYLDAFLPDDGQSLHAMTGQDADGIGPAPGTGWLVTPPERAYDSAADAAWANARRQPQPIACFREPVALSRPLEEHDFSLTYVKATADPDGSPGAPVFWAAAERTRTDQRWRYAEIATDHLIPQKDPAAVAKILLGLL
jgi:pimeloyl-ACP methyl ester carboxylesterase